MFIGKLVLLCGLAATALLAAPHISAQEPGVRCARYKGGSGKQKAQKPQTRAGQQVKDIDALAEALKAQGLNVQGAGEVSQPFFSVEGRALSVGGENVQVFRYATAEAAGKDAAQVSPDGSSVGTSMMTWVAPPHFYRKDNLLVLYVGTNAEVLRALQSVMGAQFAGR